MGLLFVCEGVIFSLVVIVQFLFALGAAVESGILVITVVAFAAQVSLACGAQIWIPVLFYRLLRDVFFKIGNCKVYGGVNVLKRVSIAGDCRFSF